MLSKPKMRYASVLFVYLQLLSCCFNVLFKSFSDLLNRKLWSRYINQVFVMKLEIAGL